MDWMNKTQHLSLPSCFCKGQNQICRFCEALQPQSEAEIGSADSSSQGHQEADHTSSTGMNAAVIAEHQFNPDNSKLTEADDIHDYTKKYKGWIWYKLTWCQYATDSIKQGENTHTKRTNTLVTKVSSYEIRHWFLVNEGKSENVILILDWADF